MAKNCDLSGALKHTDQFGEAFHMKLKGNNSFYRSYIGAFCSFILSIFLTMFIVAKLQTLILKSDVDILQNDDDNAIGQTERFSEEDGFFVAAGITAYDKDPNIIEKEEYGEIIIEQYGWANEELGYENGSREIPMHWCSESEIGMSDNDDSGTPSRAFPLVEHQLAEVSRYRRKFKCIKPEDTVIWGNYDGESAM